MAKKRKIIEKEPEQRPPERKPPPDNAMANALLALRHAAEAATPPHYRTPAWKQAIANADTALHTHFNPHTGA